MNVYLIGSFMNDNFGDYLLYHETLKTIQDTFGDKVNVISSDVSPFYDNFSTVNRMTHKEALKKADVILFTGGGYFGEGDRKKLLWNLFFIRYFGLKALSASLSKKPYVIVGVGAGPFKYRFSRFITRVIFKNASVISVRDNESKNFLKTIGVENDVEVHCDWILGMDCYECLNMPENNIENKYHLSRGNRYLIVHLISKLDNNSGLCNALADVRRYLCHNPDIRIIVTCDQSKKDVYKRTKIISTLFEEELAVYYEYKSPWELLKLISLSNVVLTDKLHVGIAALNLGKNVVSIPLHSKTPRFYRQIGRCDMCKMMDKLEINDVYKMLEKAFDKNPPDLTHFKQDSLMNRKITEKFIWNYLQESPMEPQNGDCVVLQSSADSED